MAATSLSSLLNSYSRKNHIDRIDIKTNQATFPISNFTFMTDPGWNSGIGLSATGILPSKIASLMIDSYYHLPSRPDMAFLYLWTAFNSAFHQIALRKAANTNKHRVDDSDGIQCAYETVNKQLNVAYQSGGNLQPLQFYVDKLFSNIPEKLCSLIATTFLKSNAIKEAGLSRRYQSKAIEGFTSRFSSIALAFENSYGKAFIQNSNPTENVPLGQVDLNIKNITRSNDITRSLSEKISTLLSTGSVSVIEHSTVSVTPNIIQLNLNAAERVEFFTRFILYASRNNMSHGKVSSRLNSDTANKKSYEANLFIYVSCYLFLALLLQDLNYASPKVVEDSIANIKGVLNI